MTKTTAEKSVNDKPKLCHLYASLKCLDEVINNCSLFERLFKVKKSGVFLFGISFSVFEIFTFLYYANEESDDVINSVIQLMEY